MFSLKIVHANENLERVVHQINQSIWDEANDMTEYDVTGLEEYLKHPDTLFVTCHKSESPDAPLMGMASAQWLIKPYAQERWLYIDEVDVCVDHRRRGAGKALMNFLIDLAEQNDCSEVWLGTETDNIAANSLYRSLKPDEEEQFIGYTFETDD